MPALSRSEISGSGPVAQVLIGRLLAKHHDFSSTELLMTLNAGVALYNEGDAGVRANVPLGS